MTRATAMRELSRLADIADVIAVAGENRYLRGKYIPSAASVMHAMRDAIRELGREEES